MDEPIMTAEPMSRSLKKWINHVDALVECMGSGWGIVRGAASIPGAKDVWLFGEDLVTVRFEYNDQYPFRAPDYYLLYHGELVAASLTEPIQGSVWHPLGGLMALQFYLLGRLEEYKEKQSKLSLSVDPPTTTDNLGSIGTIEFQPMYAEDGILPIDFEMDKFYQKKEEKQQPTQKVPRDGDDATIEIEYESVCDRVKRSARTRNPPKRL